MEELITEWRKAIRQYDESGELLAEFDRREALLKRQHLRICRVVEDASWAGLELKRAGCRSDYKSEDSYK